MLTKTDLAQISKTVRSSEDRLTKKMDKLERKLDYDINFLDIEEHLGITSSAR